MIAKKILKDHLVLMKFLIMVTADFEFFWQTKASVPMLRLWIARYISYDCKEKKNNLSAWKARKPSMGNERSIPEYPATPFKSTICSGHSTLNWTP